MVFRHWKKILVVALLLAILAYLALPLKNISVESVRITGVDSVSTSGATLNGELVLTNPAHLPLPVTNAKYKFILNRTGTVLTTGTVPQFTLARRTETTTAFTQELTWQRTGTLGRDLLTRSEVPIDIRGNVTIRILGFTFTKPFSEQYDLKQYVEDALTQPLTDTLENGPDETDNTSDGDTTIDQVRNTIG